MPQPEGSSSSTTGRVGAQIGTAAAVAAFVLGAGWGTTATLAISVAGANDQRGVVQVTSTGTGQAQATATIAFTFTDGAYAVKPPFASAWCNSSTSALTDQLVLACSWTTTVLTMTFPILPVAAKVYLISYLIVP
jgi:hypothetical protein